MDKYETKYLMCHNYIEVSTLCQIPYNYEEIVIYKLTWHKKTGKEEKYNK